jgi:hypothetical protein
MVRATTLLKTAAHEEGVWATAWLAGTSSLLTGSVDETVKQWSIAEDRLECVHTYSGHALGVISLDVDPSGTLAVSSALDSMIRVFGVEDKAMKHLLERPPTETWQTAFGVVSADSTQLGVAGGSTGQVFTYRGSTEEPGLELTLDLPQVRVTGWWWWGGSCVCARATDRQSGAAASVLLSGVIHRAAPAAARAAAWLIRATRKAV